MANHKSAQKRIRRNEARAKINHARISRVRTFMKKVELAIDAGNAEDAKAAFAAAMPEIHRGVTKGVMHKNTAARRLSRMSRRIKALAA